MPLDKFFKLKNGKYLRILTPEQFHQLRLQELEQKEIQKIQEKDKKLGQENLLDSSF